MNVLNEKTISCRKEITSKIIKLYLLTESDLRKKITTCKKLQNISWIYHQGSTWRITLTGH